MGPVIDSAAQVPVHSLRDRDQLTNFRPCDVVVKGVTGAVYVKVTEQADRELAGGDIVMRDGVLMDTKDSLLPEDDIIDQGYIGIKYKTGSARKCVYIPEEGAHARLEGEAERKPIHCVRDGKDWRMTLEKPLELANDIEVKLAEVKGRQAVVQQEALNPAAHTKGSSLLGVPGSRCGNQFKRKSPSGRARDRAVFGYGYGRATARVAGW